MHCLIKQVFHSAADAQQCATPVWVPVVLIQEGYVNRV